MCCLHFLRVRFFEKPERPESGVTFEFKSYFQIVAPEPTSLHHPHAAHGLNGCQSSLREMFVERSAVFTKGVKPPRSLKRLSPYPDMGSRSFVSLWNRLRLTSDSSSSGYHTRFSSVTLSYPSSCDMVVNR